ncbi:ABC transporter ATP-binding protein [Breznakia pachnodae]|uniref:ABC-type multidrug transport system fused ATPase/permease subunit n=1 Tax=Breznakia pachnodae TaxID=265178 RepID=A0ABU0DXB0_9FIRM|nr:ABC transporter ATP-binding protein [Breznakia pachnodae]MDQ0359278.1 ABC-type multidrug transport system fused ATPase/permease subunit [Breznakia pachnodae]
MKYKDLRKQFYKGNIVNLCLAIVGSLLTVAYSISIAFFIKDFFDALLTQDATKFYDVFMLCFVSVFLILAGIGIENYFMNKFCYRAVKQYKNFVCERILKKDIASFQNELTSDYLSALTNDVNSIDLNYLQGGIKLYKQYLLMICAIVSMLLLNWKLFLCVCAISVLLVLSSNFLKKTLINMELEESKQNSGFMGFFKDILSGFTVVKGFKAETLIYDNYAEKNVNLEKIKRKKRNVATVIRMVSGVSSHITFYGIIGIGGYFVFEGMITPGIVIAFVQLLNYLVGPIQEINPLRTSKKAAEKLIEKCADLLSKETTDKTELVPYESFDKTITFEDVSFGYTDTNVLDSINFTFEKGKSYAVVGASGSGKSTFLQLLQGFYKNYNGNIHFDNQELKDIDVDSLYGHLSIIQQNVFIFDDTIMNNITMYQKFSEKELQAAIKKSGLDELIKERGTDYKCGENGVKLSGGEKQRISIARSLIRNTPILLMDEGTSSLDNQTAFRIEQSILSIQDLTKVIITHKLNEDLLRQYDCVLVFHNGQIKESGTFNELMDKKGYLQSLYNVVTV